MVFLSQSRSTSANIKAHKSEIRHKKMKMVPKRLERFPEMAIAIILVSDMKLLLMWSQLPCRLTRRLYHPQRPTPNTSRTPPQWRHTHFVRSCPPFYLLMACSSVTALFLVQITSPSTLSELQVIFYPANDNFIQTLFYSISHLQWVCNVSTLECTLFQTKDGTLCILWPADLTWSQYLTWWK